MACHCGGARKSWSTNRFRRRWFSRLASLCGQNPDVVARLSRWKSHPVSAKSAETRVGQPLMSRANPQAATSFRSGPFLIHTGRRPKIGLISDHSSASPRGAVYISTHVSDRAELWFIARFRAQPRTRRPGLHIRARFVELSSAVRGFPPIDVGARFILICAYTGKEVV
jgi:hypothetical protein